MQETKATDTELFILRSQIEIRLLHLGVDSHLRRRIVQAVARISNVHKLTLVAHGLGCNFDFMRGSAHKDNS